MKTAKKVLLFIMGLMIVSMIILLSCKNRYTGPGDKGIFEEGSSGETGENGGGGDSGPIPLVGSGGGLIINGYTLPINSLSQEEQEQDYDPEFNSVVLFNEGIPALTVTAKGVILAASGTSESANYIVVKRSSDMGKTWTEVQANTSDSDLDNMQTHPFFINGYDGSVLMGVATTNATKNKTTIYKSQDDGMNWSKLTQIDTNIVNKGNMKVHNGYVTYGQGITLRHQSDSSQKLLFPYFYGTNSPVTKHGYTATMCSTDGGNSFTQLGNPYGKFSSYETKFIELSDGKILLNMRADNNLSFWMISSDCGANWTVTTKNTDNENDYGNHADLIRYEFDGKDIRDVKDALMIHSTVGGNAYTVRLTENDFNDGKAGNKYQHMREDLAEGKAKDDGYPAITVLPDGTIATLTEENSGVVFRRFNLHWLTYGVDVIDYNQHLKFK